MARYLAFIQAKLSQRDFARPKAVEKLRVTVFYVTFATQKAGRIFSLHIDGLSPHFCNGQRTAKNRPLGTQAFAVFLVLHFVCQA